MDIWIIRNGVKTGPIPDYEIRHRIAAGDITAETRVWHDGLPEWTPISKIPLYENEFKSVEERRAATPPPVPVLAPGSEILATPQKPGGPSYIRRFCARWLDLHLYAAVWWLALWAIGRDISTVYGNPWIIYSLYIPWFVVESVLLHRFASTPGKWLLGIRILNEDGTHLTLKAATWRSIRVLTIGIGLGWSILSLFCQGLSLFTARRLGKPVWDHFGGHQATGKPLKPLGITAAVILFFVAAQLQMAVIAPYAMKQAALAFPQMKEQIEKNPPWHLPPRH